MIPILFSETEKSFNNNGIGRLADALSVVCTEERNGAFEVDFEYPIKGRHYEDIKFNSIIKCKPNQTDRDQLFFVFDIYKNLTTITVKCRHISYLLSGMPVRPYSAVGMPAAFNAIKGHLLADSPFNFHTDLVREGNFYNRHPISCKALLGGVDGSILDHFKGEYRWDNFDVYLLEHRGEDNGVTVRYGKNMTSLTQEGDVESGYSHVLAYWYNQNDYTCVTGDIVAKTDFDYPYTFVQVYDATSDFSGQPTSQQLSELAIAKAKEKSIPQLYYTVSYVDEAFAKVKLCDTVTVYHEDLGINIKKTVTRTVFNVLTERYEEITLGGNRAQLGDTLTNIADMAASNVGERGEQGIPGPQGPPGVSASHRWDGTKLYITSASGTSFSDLKGEKGDAGDLTTSITNQNITYYITRSKSTDGRWAKTQPATIVDYSDGRREIYVDLIENDVPITSSFGWYRATIRYDFEGLISNVMDVSVNWNSTGKITSINRSGSWVNGHNFELHLYGMQASTETISVPVCIRGMR